MKPQRSKLPIKLVLFVGTLLAAAVCLTGYFWVEKVKTEALSTGKAEMDALHGEVYRLSQHTEQQKAKMNYLLDPKFERILLKKNDENFCWLFYSAVDNAWYAEVSRAEELEEAFQYRLYTRDKGNEATYIGHFERIADTVGLQKIGQGVKQDSVLVTVAHRDEPPLLEDENVLYRVGT